MEKIKNTKNFKWILEYIEYCRSAYPETARIVLEAAKESLLEKKCFGKKNISERLRLKGYLLNGNY